MGLQAEIWTWRLGEGGTKEMEEEEEKEKTPHMCESTGQPLPKKGGGSSMVKYGFESCNEYP